MAKSFQGFANYNLLGVLSAYSVCDCCGAMVMNDKGQGVDRSIVMASNLSEEQMRAGLVKLLSPRVSVSQEYCNEINKKYNHPWEFTSVPLGEGETLSLLLQLPAKE